jgi:NAD(P)-dependent dehydrogenase (short-subunit alcohol dehydrogenase family)
MPHLGGARLRQTQEDRMVRLADKTVLITGAGAGIGRAAALLFAREGAKVAIAEIDRTAGEETAHRIASGGGTAIAVPTDVTEPESVAAAVEATLAAFGKLDILYNNAGGSTPRDGTAVEAPIEEFWRAIRLDLFGTFLGCRFGIPALIKNGGGSVINTASNVALMGVPGLDCYTAAKGGIVSLTRSLAVEFATHRVRVNALAPSATGTERVNALLASRPNVADLARAHLLGLGEPIDVAHAALYLASDESCRVTGTIMRIDSGVTIS